MRRRVAGDKQFEEMLRAAPHLVALPSPPSLSLSFSFSFSPPFQSNEFQNHSEVLEAMLGFGGDVLTQMHKDSLVHSVNFIPDQLQSVVDVLAKGVLHPLFSDEEVEEQLAILQYAPEQIHANPAPLVTDLLYTAAFNGTLGNKSVLFPEDASHITPGKAMGQRERECVCVCVSE